MPSKNFAPWVSKCSFASTSRSIANAGAVSCYNMQFLHLTWEQPNYNVTEGGGTALSLVRETNIERLQVISVESIDRNGDAEVQYNWAMLLGIDRENVPQAKTVTDLAGAPATVVSKKLMRPNSDSATAGVMTPAASHARSSPRMAATRSGVGDR